MERDTDGLPEGRDPKARLRRLVAREAASVMYREGVSQYFDAKRIAAKRVFGKDARASRFRPSDLPSNGEIRAELLELVALAEGVRRPARLFAMRVEALRWMKILAGFHPRLIGSVWTGYARHGSDIDLHVFAESIEPIERALDALFVAYEREEVLIRDGGDFRLYQHLYLQQQRFPVELSVYPLHERKHTTRSSVDGRPIDRVSAKRLAKRTEEENPMMWEAWLKAGGLEASEESLDDLLGSDDGDEPGEFDGLLAELGKDRE